MNLQSLCMLILGFILGTIVCFCRVKYKEKQNYENEKNRKQDFNENYNFDLSDRK